MAAEHYLPLFVGDFMASTATWTGPERGLYLQMLAFQWSSGPLPCDPPRLARALGYEWSEFELIWPVVRAKFNNGDGKLTNARLEEHREKSNRLAAMRHAKAVLAANSKHAPSSAPRMLQASSEQCLEHVSDPILSDPIRSKKKSKSTTARKGAPTWFAEFQSAYPPRAGSQEWGRALRAANARIAEGHGPDEFIDGARRYAAFIAASGKQHTEFVKQAATFLGPGKGFLEPWTAPASKADLRLASNVSVLEQFIEGAES